ncbi:UvrD-helicase domain-containing protein [bacterium]|nr:UvrD-helicase domain-containing protein [candidate division CSSED10-310 bacterium]
MGNDLVHTMSIEQMKAVSLDRNIAVTAGAGSGKTRVLATRYLRLLESHVGIMPDQIVALTFSRKASADMRNRIRDDINAKLRAASRDGSGLDRWRSIQRRIPLAPIGTIHSFAAGILREFPNEARIDPAFAVAEDTAQQSLAWRAAQRNLRRWIETGDPQGDLRQMTGYFSRRECIDLTAQIIADPLLMETIQSGSAGVTDWDQVWDVFAFRTAGSPVLSETAAFLKDCPPRTGTESRIREVLLDSIPKLAAARTDRRFDALDALLGILFTRSGDPASSRNLRGMREPVERLQELLQPLHWLHGIHRSDIHPARLIESLGRISERARDELRGLQRTVPVLSFDDLEHLTLRLLRHSTSRSRIVAILKSRYHFFLVDEFQDTNRNQWRIIEPLVCDAAGRPELGKLFIVGDPKQSIYGFRGAEVAVFSEIRSRVVRANREENTSVRPFESLKDLAVNGVADSGGEREGDIRLTANYRSRGKILECVERICAPIMKPGLPFEIPFESLQVKRSGEGTVGLLLPVEYPEPAEPPDSKGYPASQATFMAGHIRSLVSDGICNYRDIAVMFPRRRFLPVIESGLRSADIPFAIYKGIGFWDRPEIRDIVAVTAWLADPSDRISLFAILRSPFFGLSDTGLLVLSMDRPDFPFDSTGPDPAEHLDSTDTRILNRARSLLRDLHARTGVVPVHIQLENFLERTGAAGGYRALGSSPRRTANIDKLLALICGIEKGGVASIREIDRRLRLNAENQPLENEEAPDLTDENLVKVMTVHAAKGLEFPVVYLTDLEAKLNTVIREKILFDPRWGTGFRLPGRHSDEKGRETAVFRIIKHERLLRELAEYKRLLYVAMTRACDRLYLVPRCGGPDRLDILDPPRRSWLQWIVDGLNLTRETIEWVGMPAAVPENMALKIVTGTGTRDRTVHHLPEGDRIRHIPAGLPVPSFAVPAILRKPPVLSATELVDYYAATNGIIPEQEPVSLENPSGRGNVAGGTGRAIGQVFHEMMEFGTFPEPADEAAEAIIERFSLDTRLKEEIGRRLARMIENVKRWSRYPLIRTGAGYREQPFSIRLKHAVIEGVIDRLIPENGGWMIVDYKTDIRTGFSSGPEWLESRTAHHLLQMELYALAVHKRLVAESQPVTAVLFFADTGEESRIRFDVKALAGIENKLDDLIYRMIDPIALNSETN